MALVPCPECGSDVSTRAAACPRCGCPVEQPPDMEAVVLQAARQAVRRSDDGIISDDDIILECYRVLGKERAQFFDERVAFANEVKDMIATLVRRHRIDDHPTIPGLYLLPN